MTPAITLLEAAKAHLAAREALDRASIYSMQIDDPRFLAIKTTLNDLRSAIDAADQSFPQPARKEGKEPCGECRLKQGETCDICRAFQP